MELLANISLSVYSRSLALLNKNVPIYSVSTLLGSQQKSKLYSNEFNIKQFSREKSWLLVQILIVTRLFRMHARFPL